MSVRFNPDVLRYELALRCMSQHDLAKKTGLSDATISAPFAGRPIAEASAELICDVLDTTPVSEFMRKLIGPCAPPPAENEAPRDPASEHER
jgi:transcriptional regulator with XRE-family HTH domain